VSPASKQRLSWSIRSVFQVEGLMGMFVGLAVLS
jgi:hypothetical protein